MDHSAEEISANMAVGPIWVVAGALRASGGVSEDTWLMQRRPFEKHHGGLWEFPGGKVEHAEIPVKALIRELHEELGIIVDAEHCIPAGFAEEHVRADVDDRGEMGDQRPEQTGPDNTRAPIVILLYTIDAWEGQPRALEGGRIGMFTPKEIELLDKPPLDQQLSARLFEKG